MAEEVKTGGIDIGTTAEVFNELRGDLTQVIIMRNGKFLDKVKPEEIDDDLVMWIKERYGGGKYIVTLQGKDGRIKKRFSFAIEGAPKMPPSEMVQQENGTLGLVRELIEEIKEKRSSDQADVFKMMMEMQRQQFELLLNVVKGKEQERKSFLEQAVEKLISNPQVLLAVGGGAWKVIQKALTNKNELLELIRVAKDDPEIKEMAVSILGAKYGAGGGILDRLLSNPEFLNKTLEIVNKALSIREAGQNPLPAVKQELRKMAKAQGQVRKEGAPQVAASGGVGSSPSQVISNPQSTQLESVDNGEEVVSVQEVIAVGTKILDLAERGATAEEIFDSLTDREVELLYGVSESYGIKDSEGLVAFLEGLPVPRFVIAGYVEAVRRHREVIDSLLGLVLGEFEEEVREDSGESLREDSGRVERERVGEGKEEVREGKGG